MNKYKYKNVSVEAENRCKALEKLFGADLIDDIDISLNVSKIPKIIDIRKSMPFVRSNGKVNFKNIKYAVVHHEGVARPLYYNSKARYIAQANHHIKNGFGHIAYNFSIDNVGDIFYLSTIGEVGYHAGNFSVNRQSIAIKLDGDLTKQKVTNKQWKAYQNLCWWLTTQRPDLPILLRGSWKKHNQVRIGGGTACPGKIDIMDF